MFDILLKLQSDYTGMPPPWGVSISNISTYHLSSNHIDMSHFVANTISFSKDFTSFKVKWWYNNVSPRHNNWTFDIPITKLLEELWGRNIQLSKGQQKHIVINNLVQSYLSQFEKDSFYKQSTERTDLFIELSKKFALELPAIIKSIDTTKNYIVQNTNQPTTQYISAWSATSKQTIVTSNINLSQKFAKDTAIYMASRFDWFEAIKI